MTMNVTVHLKSGGHREYHGVTETCITPDGKIEIHYSVGVDDHKDVHWLDEIDQITHHDPDA